ncbi:MAG: hypothetical protein IJD32_06590 [Bacteroidaceae bacterium]|nr:hypothetical protein [Bacteroidaceae bacterium]MBQ4056756.1 hypothetical protein [Bacteroidaceae bacterium]
MKFLKVLSSLLIIFALSSAFTMGDEKKGVYVAGVSASFADSLVYFTDVLFVDSVELDKDKFLPFRYEYSSQLQDYMLQKYGSANRTCFVYFNQNKAKLEKSLKKLKEKYQKSGKSQLRQVDSSFKFKKAVGY